MSLRPLLSYAADDESVPALARGRGEAFVSPSLRPFLIAALVDDPARADRPALVIAGDDRAARDLAGDLRVWLGPRPVRFYPSRGVAYESHLAPPPHLVGLRVAALDALLAHSPVGSGGTATATATSPSDPPVVIVSAVAL